MPAPWPSTSPPPATCSSAWSRLEYVDKRRDGNDQRTVSLHVTPRGIVAQRGAPQPRTGVLQQALAELPPASLVALRTHLSKLIEVMRGKDRCARRTPLSEM